MTSPHVREIVCFEPSVLAQRLTGERHLLLLESVMRQEHLGRYSFLACNPRSTIEATHQGTFRDGIPQKDDVLSLISRTLEANRRPFVPGLPPFQGGLAGFISYDFGRRLEPHARIPDFAPVCPDLVMHHYDAVAAFDHMQERAWIIAGDTAEADRLEDLINRKPRELGSHALSGWQSNFSREDYECAIARTVEYILAGDIFQANITQEFSTAIPAGFDPFAFYRMLRQRNPATFAAYLDFGTIQIASSSPERLLKLNEIAITQMRTLLAEPNVKRLKA